MADDTVQGAAKTSRYGDLPGLFERHYEAFFLAPKELQPRAYAGIMGIAKAVAEKNGDAKLRELYDASKKDNQVNEDEMLLLVWESFRVMFEDGTWTKTQQPFAFLTVTK